MVSFGDGIDDKIIWVAISDLINDEENNRFWEQNNPMSVGFFF